MSWNRCLLALLACSFTGCAAQTPAAGNVCPAREAPLRYLDVFDGTAAENARLMADVDGDTAGHWHLAYVYDAGRSVTIRCKYADRTAVDVPLPHRIKRCDYRVSASKQLSLTCR